MVCLVVIYIGCTGVFVHVHEIVFVYQSAVFWIRQFANLLSTFQFILVDIQRLIFFYPLKYLLQALNTNTDAAYSTSSKIGLLKPTNNNDSINQKKI